MPSSFSFLLNSQSNSSSSSSENDSKSDQSDDDDDDDIGYYKKRAIQNDKDMLERPSDDGDSCSQSDDTDNDDDEKKNDIFTASNNTQSHFLTRQVTLYDNDWPRKSSIDENKLKKSVIRDEATLLEIERDDSLFLHSNQHRLFSPERSRSVGTTDQKQQSRNIHTLLPSDYTVSTNELHTIQEPDNMQPLSSSRTKASTITSPKRPSIVSTKQIINEERQRSPSKIPVRTNSSSPSRSHSPTTKSTNRRVQSPTSSSKIPVPVSTISKGAFRFFTADDRPSLFQPPPATDSSQIPSQPVKKVSPFAPITHPKSLPSSSIEAAARKKISSSAGNTPSARHRRVRIVSSDDDDDESETNHIPEADLKVKLKEQKRHGKQTGELLNQLHENYEQLLEKYAQAENTIDQLRFQPKIFGDNTPPSNTSEGTIHFIQQSKMNMATLRSSGVYHSTSGTPLSSMRPANSSTTTTTTPARKSTSPTNSGTIESVFYDEPVSQQIIVQELTTPETVKLDLLIQTKTLSDKMKSFLTLMDANQLSLAEQKQVYESIKNDYEKLLKAFDQTKRGGDLSDIDLDADLNKELETMKQLLNEIVKRITDNLLGKSTNGSETGRQSRLTRDGSHSSQLSPRSSLCNHGDLMDQYQKLLNAVNTDVTDKRNGIKSVPNGLETSSRQMKKTTSRDSSQSDTSGHLPSTANSRKPYVYASGNSDDDQEQSNGTTPVPLMKGTESTSFGLNYIPSPSGKHHRQINEEQAHIHGITIMKKKKKVSTKREIQEYDNLENITKSKRKTKPEQKRITNDYQDERELSPTSLSIPTGATRYSASSMRTRTSDYDSGIGTNNTTKLSRDSKLNTTALDESHYQSLDEEQRERRRYSDEEQESMSSVSSSRSSGSGAASSGSPYSKYTKISDSSSALKQHNEHYRRKPSGHSDAYPSDIETHITASFDPLPQTPSYQKNSRRSHHSLQPKRIISDRSRLTPYQRSVSTESFDIDNYQTKLHRPQTAPQTANHNRMARKYQTGVIHRQTMSSQHPETMYKSSFYIDQAHTHRRSQEKLDHNQRQYYEHFQTPNRKQRYIQQANNLYFDSQTGIVYRYVPNTTTRPATYYQPTSQVKSSKELYQCVECGSVTTYHHRHHINSTMRRAPADLDDPGYESGNRKINQRRRYIDNLVSSDSEPDETATYFDMSVLNEAYERARKVQHRSQNLSKHISRQLKLVIANI